MDYWKNIFILFAIILGISFVYETVYDWIYPEVDPCEGIEDCRIYTSGSIKYPIVYDLDLDSLASCYSIERLQDKIPNINDRLNGKKIILTYQNGVNKSYLFDVSSQNSLPKKYHPKDFKETDFIVLRKFTKETRGYSNNITKGYIVTQHLFFIDPNSFEVVKKINVSGGNLPTTSRKETEWATASNEEIQSAILRNLSY